MAHKSTLNYARGERHPQCKLSAVEVADIRRRYDRGGETYRSLATSYRVSASTIADVLNNRTWRSQSAKN